MIILKRMAYVPTLQPPGKVPVYYGQSQGPLALLTQEINETVTCSSCSSATIIVLEVKDRGYDVLTSTYMSLWCNSISRGQKFWCQSQALAWTTMANFGKFLYFYGKMRQLLEIVNF